MPTTSATTSTATSIRIEHGSTPVASPRTTCRAASPHSGIPPIRGADSTPLGASAPSVVRCRHCANPTTPRSGHPVGRPRRTAAARQYAAPIARPSGRVLPPLSGADTAPTPPHRETAPPVGRPRRVAAARRRAGGALAERDEPSLPAQICEPNARITWPKAPSGSAGPASADCRWRPSCPGTGRWAPGGSGDRRCSGAP